MKTPTGRKVFSKLHNNDFFDFLENEGDLFHEDASLSLGWFEFHSNEMRISLFNRGYCMVFLTLGTLIDFLIESEKRLKNSFRWVGEDNGGIFILTREKNQLYIQTDKIRIAFDYAFFVDEIFAKTRAFLSHARHANKEIIKEGPYIDLSTRMTKRFDKNIQGPI